MFQLTDDFTHLAFQWLFLCAICLDAEPLHFAWKSFEFSHASLYRLSLKDKLTLDLSRYMWESILEIPLVVTFFLIANFQELYLKFLKWAICDGIH